MWIPLLLKGRIFRFHVSFAECIDELNLIGVPQTTSIQGAYSLVPRPETRGIPNTMVCRILMFIYSTIPYQIIPYQNILHYAYNTPYSNTRYSKYPYGLMWPFGSLFTATLRYFNILSELRWRVRRCNFSFADRLPRPEIHP